MNLFLYVEANPVNLADPWGLDPIDPKTGKTNPVTRCHVVTHNDPTENLYGAALVGVPLAGLLAGTVASSAAPMALAEYGPKVAPYLPYVPYYVQRWGTGYRPWGQLVRTTVIPFWDSYQEGVEKNRCPTDYKKGCHNR
jgi:hypothetical protein